MDERVTRTIQGIETFRDLAQFERNVRKQAALTSDVEAAIRTRSKELGRTLVAQRTGLDLSGLTEAEEKIVEAVSEYAGIMKRQGKDAGRTLKQLKSQGLIGAAEISVSKAKPTQGYQELVDADLTHLSYEQIILDHPDDFSTRAIWYARRTLGLPNDSDKPPARKISLTQSRTETLLRWLAERRNPATGRLTPFSNADGAAALGIGDLSRYGRPYGNIQSRIDFACYKTGLPPLGLAAKTPFDEAWSQEGRTWTFPISAMQAAAQSRAWRQRDFDAVLKETERLPGQASISWRKEVTENELAIREWAESLAVDERSPDLDEGMRTKSQNPDWSVDELILALDLYLRFREAPPRKASAEVIELAEFLGRMGKANGIGDATKYRNPNGIYMKMMNFRRFDPQYTAEGRVGLTRGNKNEEVVWHEFAEDRERLAASVAAIRAEYAEIDDVETQPQTSILPTETVTPYWVFVCNPKKWAIDKFLDHGAVEDAWGVRPSDRKAFAPGQLGVIRVGVDRRTAKERAGGEPLKPGIYALCEVDSEAFPSTGASDDFWAAGQARAAGWPTVRIRYLKTFRRNPLTIQALRDNAPNISPLVLNGFQAASFPISDADFRAITSLLGADVDDLPTTPATAPQTADEVAEAEKKYLNAAPEVKERVSKSIERGTVGARLKKELKFRCQLCDALGLVAVGFSKKNGEPYVEAHHVMPVSKLQVGSLAASNVMIVCANHHRQLHFGNVEVIIEASTFEFDIEGKQVSVGRNGIG